MIISFENYQNYNKLDQPIDFIDFECIGYFPYSTAFVQEKEVQIAHPPRVLLKPIEDKLAEHRIQDNKTVYIFNDKLHFGTTNFAIMFKDFRCVIGTWDQVTGYAGKALEEK